MDLWIKFWAVLLFGGLALFVCMAVAVAIGGASDVKALFKSLTDKIKKAKEAEESSAKQDR